MKNLIPIFIAIILATGCKVVQKSQDGNQEVTQLQQMMTGSFNSEKQAMADSNYYNITLHMYPVWLNRTGNWLYVEQAVTANQAKPYRQRFYELKKLADGSIASYVYLINEPEKAVQKWKEPHFFENLTMADIKLKEGCEVVLKKQKDGSYKGTTGDKTCPSSLRSAAYANSIVSVFSDKIVSWDQGFDVEGKQVWGATEGGYIFDKQ